jgi:prevent-host-death family protein
MSLHFGELMEKAVTAADANRKFSTLLRAVREGQTYVVTSHGRAVARVVPLENNPGIARNARAALVKRLRSEPVVRVGRWSREELYEDQQ